MTLTEAIKYALQQAEKDWMDVLNTVGGLSEKGYERAMKEPTVVQRKKNVEALRELVQGLEAMQATTHDVLRWAAAMLDTHGAPALAFKVKGVMTAYVADVPLTPTVLKEEA